MSDQSSRSQALMDFVNISFAFIPWVLPDINVFIKVTIGFVLIGVLIIARTKPSFMMDLSGFHYVLLLILPIIIAVTEYFLVWALMTLLIPNQSELKLFTVVQLGIAYGLVIGFPIALFSFKNRNPENVVSAGCVIQAVLEIIGVVLGTVLINMKNLFFIFSSSLWGPLYFLGRLIYLVFPSVQIGENAPISFVFMQIKEDIIMSLFFNLLILGFFWLQNAQFVLVSEWLAKKNRN